MKLTLALLFLVGFIASVSVAFPGNVDGNLEQIADEENPGLLDDPGRIFKTLLFYLFQETQSQFLMLFFIGGGR